MGTKLTDPKQRATAMCASVPLWYLEKLDDYCAKHNRKMNEVIRSALNAYLGLE